MKKIWIFLIVLLLTGCGSKDKCPVCSHAVDLAQDVFCSKCGMTFTGIKPDGYEEITNNTHMGKWCFLIPTDDYSGDSYDVAIEVFLTIKEDQTYDLQFSKLILNKDSISYQEVITEYGSESAAEDAARQEIIALSKEIAHYTGCKYNLVQDETSLSSEFEDIYYDSTFDEILFLADGGLVLVGTRS